MLTDQTYSDFLGTVDTSLVAGGVAAQDMQYEPAFWIGEVDNCLRCREIKSKANVADVVTKGGLAKAAHTKAIAGLTEEQANAIATFLK